MDNILLKDRTLSNVKIYWQKTQDEELMKLFPFIKKTLKDAIYLYEESLKPGAKSYGKVIYVDDKYIGDVWCFGIDECIENKAFISIVIFDKAYFGKGIGKRILLEFTKIIFNKYNLKKLCAFTYKDNERSIRTLESIGFKKVEEFKENNRLSCYYELYSE